MEGLMSEFAPYTYYNGECVSFDELERLLKLELERLEQERLEEELRITEE